MARNTPLPLLVLLIASFPMWGCSSPDEPGISSDTNGSVVGDTEDPADVPTPLPDTSEDAMSWDGGLVDVNVAEDTTMDTTMDTSEPEDVPSTPNDVISPTDTSPEEDTLIEEDTTSAEDTTIVEDTVAPEDTVVPEDTVAPEEDIAVVEDTTPPEEDTTGSSWLAECPGTLTIMSPTPDAFFYIGDPISLVATSDLDPNALPDGAQVQWEDASGWVLHTSDVVNANGVATSEGSYMATTVDDFPIHARLITSEGACTNTVNVLIHTCAEKVEESFDGGLGAGWIALDSATWQNANGPDSWVELTGNVQGSRGALYNQDVTVDAGSASVKITFATGGGINSGADGLAMTVVDLDTLDDLLNMIDSAHSGGGLGYGVAGEYGPWVGDALHVEVDTWYNSYNGTTEFHTDPTSQNHVAIALNGDPGNDVWFAAIPTIEDLNWHTIQIDIIDSNIKVFFDEELMVTQNVVDLEFRGGYIYFSASTGWATNFHRIGHLDVIHSCK